MFPYPSYPSVPFPHTNILPVLVINIEWSPPQAMSAIFKFWFTKNMLGKGILACNVSLVSKPSCPWSFDP